MEAKDIKPNILGLILERTAKLERYVSSGNAKSLYIENEERHIKILQEVHDSIPPQLQLWHDTITRINQMIDNDKEINGANIILGKPEVNKCLIKHDIDYAAAFGLKNGQNK